MHYYPSKAGFTLLELLVVMAIIGILVLVSVSFIGGFKSKGGDAGVKQNLLNARSQISTYYLNSGNSYLNVCADTTVRRMVQSAARAADITPIAGGYANGDVGDWDSEACHATATAWAVWVPLKNSTSAANTSAWCIDSTNASRNVTGNGTTLGANATVCP